MIVIGSADGTSESNDSAAPMISLVNVLALLHAVGKLQKRYKQNRLNKKVMTCNSYAWSSGYFDRDKPK
jgi:hypothetical protein